MISYIKGQIISRDDKSVTIVTGNIGYQIFATTQTLLGLHLGQEVEMFTHLDVKETSLQLFGFTAQIDKEMFSLLLEVRGIGPKSALGVLEKAAAKDLEHAIASGDHESLSRLYKIGPKTAETIVKELHEKISKEPLSSADIQIATDRNELIDALTSFGYSPIQIKNILSQISSEATTLEKKIKEALKLLR